MRQMTETRPDDGRQTQTWQQTVMREEYAETAERGLGHLHAIVSQALDLKMITIIVIHISPSSSAYWWRIMRLFYQSNVINIDRLGSW